MAEDKESDRPEKPLPLPQRFLEWCKRYVIGGMIIAAFGIGFGWWLNSQVASLHVVVGKVRSVAENIGKFDVVLENDGSRYAEEVELEIKLSRGRIMSAVPDEEASILRADVQLNEKGSQCFIAIPRMNRGEKFLVSVSVIDPFEIEKRLSVIARAKDVQAKGTDSNESMSITMWLTLRFVGGMLLALFIMMSATAFLEITSAGLRDKRREAYLSKAYKVILFVNGPMRGKYVAGDIAALLYESMSDAHRRLDIDGTTYFRWSLHDDGGVLRLAMVCDDSKGATGTPSPSRDTEILD